MDTIFNMPADQAIALYGQPKQPAQPGIADYLPNIFGRFNQPVAGLLGEQQSAALGKQANVSGLLGAAIALANGMSAQGPRRSAAQNILTALGSGLQASQGTYQQGLQNYIQQTQFATQMDKQRAFQLAAEKYPDLAPLFKIAPEKAVEMVLERESRRGIDQAYQDSPPTASPAAPVSLSAIPQSSPVPQSGEVVAGVDPSMPSMPAVEVVAPRTPVDPMLGNLKARKERLMRVAERLDRLNTKEANDESKSILEQIKSIDEQIGRYGVGSLDFAAQVKALPPEYRQRGEALLEMQQFLTPDQFSQRFETLMKDAQPKTSDIQEYNYAVSKGYTGSFQDWVKFAGSSRATNINLGDKEFGKELGKNAATIVERTYNNALAAQNSLSTISRIRPIIQDGVYSGPFSGSTQFIDRVASVLNIASNNTEEKLQRTVEAMQGLAGLELSAADALKGQGVITDFERKLIARAAGGNLAEFTQKEVVSLLDALEKASNTKIKSHQKSIDFLRRKPETRDMADLYTLDPTETPATKPSQSSGIPDATREAAREELRRRKSQQPAGRQ